MDKATRRALRGLVEDADLPPHTSTKTDDADEAHIELASTDDDGYVLRVTSRDAALAKQTATELHRHMPHKGVVLKGAAITVAAEAGVNVGMLKKAIVAFAKAHDGVTYAFEIE